MEIKKFRSSGSEGVPDTPESKPLKVLQVERRKIGHAKGREAERDPGVADTATGEILFGGTLPKLVVEFPAARRESKGFPSRMLSVAADDFGRMRGCQRASQDGRIPQVEVEFCENKLTQRHVIAAGKFFQK